MATTLAVTFAFLRHRLDAGIATPTAVRRAQDYNVEFI